MHWKSLRRQIRVRGLVSKEEGPQADAYLRLTLTQKSPWRVGKPTIPTLERTARFDGGGGESNSAARSIA